MYFQSDQGLLLGVYPGIIMSHSERIWNEPQGAEIPKYAATRKQSVIHCKCTHEQQYTIIQNPMIYHSYQIEVDTIE